MLLQENRLRHAAEDWLAEVDGLAFGKVYEEHLGIRHAAYRAAAIAVMKSISGPIHDNVHPDTNKRGRVRRIGERFETPTLPLSQYKPSSVSVGVARNVYEGVPTLRSLLSRRPPEPPAVVREDFYIRNVSIFGDSSDPDIRQEDWSVPRSAVARLPLRGTAPHETYIRDMPRFGREIAHLAVALDVELPTTIEDIQATRLERSQPEVRLPI